jgi:dTDP-4-amino-4,6-dideoxygalactose transaminase
MEGKMELRIPLSDMDYGPEEEQAALDVIHRRWLTMGAVTQDFEREFSSFIGVEHALAVSNCTDALHMACVALGIGPGDEVIAPALSFVATTNAVLYTGAEVRFADILSPGELTISPEDIERQITARTRAVMVMHYGGFPCHMPEIMEIARRKGLAVIEDAAHAPGASMDGRALGTWGEFGCFSFFSNKNLATGEGGMLVTGRDDLADKARVLRSHGMTTLTWDRHRGHAYSYDVVALGHNYRIDEIRSALGLVQLRKLGENNALRSAITGRYRQGLSESTFAGIEIPFMNAPGSSACHIFPILLPEEVDRLVFMESMRNQGVQTSIHYPPIHQFSYYRNRYPGVVLPVTESVAAREVTLPLYPAMRAEDVDYVLSSVSVALAAARESAPGRVPAGV